MLFKILNILQEILNVLLEIRADLKLLVPVNTEDKSEVLLDSSDAKRYLKVCDSTIYRWRKKNLIPYRIVGNKLFYSKTDLMKFKK